jgi:hypothetical protein
MKMGGLNTLPEGAKAGYLTRFRPFRAQGDVRVISYPKMLPLGWDMAGFQPLT